MYKWVSVILSKEKGSHRILLFAPRSAKKPQEEWLFGLPGEKALTHENSDRAAQRIMRTLYGVDVSPVGEIFYEEEVSSKPPHNSPHFFHVWVVEKVSVGALRFDPKVGISKWCLPEEIEKLFKEKRVSPNHTKVIQRYFEEVFKERISSE